MLKSRSRPSLLVQLVDLTLIQLCNWRWSWRGMLITGIAAPLFSMVGLGVFARDAGPRALAYVLTGNVVLSLMFENMNKVQGHFSYMRAAGSLSYFASLPIQRYSLILATVLSFLLLSLPSLVVTIAVGSFLLGVPLRLHPLILLAVPLTAVPLAGLGALVATAARTPQEAGSLTMLLTLVMLGLGPVVVPTDRLPRFMLVLGRLSPATYAASAWRQVLLGPLTWAIALDLAVLAGFAVVTFWLVGRKMDWRQR